MCKRTRGRKRIPSANLFRNVTFLRASCSLISLGESLLRLPVPTNPLPTVHRLPPSDFRAASTTASYAPGQVKCCNIQIARTVTFLRVSSPEEEGWGKLSREWKERREWALRRAKERERARGRERVCMRERDGAEWNRLTHCKRYC